MRNGQFDVTFLCSPDSADHFVVFTVASLDGLLPHTLEGTDTPEVYGRTLAQGIKDGVPVWGVWRGATTFCG